MTLADLLGDRRTRYLFEQHGWTYYSCGNRFYKVREAVVLAADRAENLL